MSIPVCLSFKFSFELFWPLIYQVHHDAAHQKLEQKVVYMNSVVHRGEQTKPTVLSQLIKKRFVWEKLKKNYNLSKNSTTMLQSHFCDLALLISLLTTRSLPFLIGFL